MEVSTCDDVCLERGVQPPPPDAITRIIQCLQLRIVLDPFLDPSEKALASPNFFLESSAIP